MAETAQQYDAVIEQCRSLFIKKMKDYGSAWRILRLPSLTDQIFIKAQRIRSLQQNESRKVDEGEASEFVGIINYCIMALVQMGLDENSPLELSAEEVNKLYAHGQRFADKRYHVRFHILGRCFVGEIASPNHDTASRLRDGVT